MASFGGQSCALGAASMSPGSQGITELRANPFSLLGKQLMGVSSARVTAKRQLASQDAGSAWATGALPHHWGASRRQKPVHLSLHETTPLEAYTHTHDHGEGGSCGDLAYNRVQMVHDQRLLLAQAEAAGRPPPAQGLARDFKEGSRGIFLYPHSKLTASLSTPEAQEQLCPGWGRKPPS